MEIFKYYKSDFYNQQNVADFSKFYLINATDDISLQDNTITCSGVYFRLGIIKEAKSLIVTIELYSWSNHDQIYTPIKKSIWADESFGRGKYIDTIINHYENIIQNFFSLLAELKHHWQIKDLVYKLEHPSFVFHYKLLNTFTQAELEELYLKHYKNYPIFNISLYRSKPSKHDFKYTFLPHVINGFYLHGIEVSVDLNDADVAVIECDEKGQITKDEFIAFLQNVD